MQKVLEDLFAGANGTLLPAHSPVLGGPWLGGGGTDHELLNGTAVGQAAGVCKNHVLMPAATVLVQYDFQFLDLAHDRYVNVWCYGDAPLTDFGLVFGFWSTLNSGFFSGENAFADFSNQVLPYTADTLLHHVQLDARGPTCNVTIDGKPFSRFYNPFRPQKPSYLTIETGSTTDAGKVAISNLRVFRA
jgi:hypothetical protein